MREYTKNMTVNTNNMGMNVRSTPPKSKERSSKTGKILGLITKQLELMTTATFTNNMMETMKHIIKDMQITQKCQKTIAT